MSEKLYNALEVCLNALETGADPGSVLNLYPELKEELAPLLDASRQARLLGAMEVPEAALRRGRARVLGHAAEIREASAGSRRHGALFSFQRLALSLGIALLFLFSSTGLVRVSAGTLPGDNLYPVKRTWEDVRLLFVFDPDSREDLEIEFERERLHEVDELLAEGRHEPISFRGVVTKQNGDLWVVSGVPVQITPESRLPDRPVRPGTAVFLQGRTNAQGYVEAEFVELLESYHALPTREPAEAESEEENSNEDNSGSNENNNEGEPGSPSNENGGESEHENENGNDNENSNEDRDDESNDNSGGNENDREEGDNENENKGNDEPDKEKEDNSGPDKGESENGNENDS